MSVKLRYLTKSRFKIGHGCPTKLFYTGKSEYFNASLDDPFLAALADGGFQVGELAKCYHPDGHDIQTLDYEEALSQTNELLTKRSVTIYEAAIKHKNLFIRADILVKRGKTIELIEVKAKSFDSSDDNPFFTKKGEISSSWEEYLIDIAFQKYVVESAFPDWNVSAYLMLADKRAKAPSSGMNQKFRISKDESGRKSTTITTPLTKRELEKHILCKISVDEAIDHIRASRYTEKKLTFIQYVNWFADNYKADTRIDTAISKNCGGCEYNPSPDIEVEGFKSGFKECWKKELSWKDKDFEDALIFDLWGFRGKDRLLEDGKYKLQDIEEEDIAPAPDKKPGLSPKQRQWMQVEKHKNNDASIYFDKEGFSDEMAKWTYPLNFIDFETSAVAIPFNQGRRPYEGIAFQFSHHVINKDGSVEHKSQYLNTEVGVFPNYDFVRNLKSALEANSGAIFRYSNHENTYLNMIYRQLQEDKNPVVDKDELIAFIKLITKSTGDSIETWEGDRCMVDQWELVKRYFYSPLTHGSNSIKYVLPAMLNSSEFLKNKYSKPIYGAEGGIKSLNFKNWTWVQIEDGTVKDPYKLLPKMFEDVSEKDFEILSEEDEIRNGGAALTAYAKMQFTEMSATERKELEKALFKYCELDTLAMVMIHEGWMDMLRSK